MTRRTRSSRRKCTTTFLMYEMKCLRGIVVKGNLVPCGQCMNCRINKGRIWTSRILMENLSSEEGYFLTLTYENVHLPVIEGSEYVPTLQRQRFQNWIKEAHRHAGPFRHYTVGELGDDTMRPHYHMAIFPSSRGQIGAIADFWSYGNHKVDPLNTQRAGYLARYTAKKLTSAKDKRLKSGQEPEFRTSSRRPALGVATALAIVDKYRQGAGKKILDQRGDVERNIRIAQKVYPIAPYLLTTIRKELGIPLLHRDRLNHPGYQEWHNNHEYAEYEPEIARAQEIQHAAKEKAVKLRKTNHRI